MLIQSPKPRLQPARPFLFTSPKCRAAIPVHDILLRYALEQASLDSSVLAIHYRSGPEIECPPVSLSGVVLRRGDSAYLLRVHQKLPERSQEDYASLKFVLDRHGLRLLERDAKDLHREPLFSNARTIWSHAGRRVTLMERLKIAVALEDGPQSVIQLQDRTRLTSDVVGAVCALACEGLLRLDIHNTALGPHTIVLGP